MKVEISIPIIIVFIHIGTLYWFFIRPIKLILRRPTIIDEMIDCGLTDIDGQAIVSELENEHNDSRMMECRHASLKN